MDARLPQTYFRVTYRDLTADRTVVLKATRVEDSSLGLGFICLSGFLLDEPGRVVDLAAEDLKQRLQDVKSLHLSMHAVLSIEEMGAGNKGLQLKKGRSNLVRLPAEGLGLPPGPFAPKRS